LTRTSKRRRRAAVVRDESAVVESPPVVEVAKPVTEYRFRHGEPFSVDVLEDGTFRWPVPGRG